MRGLDAVTQKKETRPRVRLLPEERRRQLVDVALRLFAENGYDATTTRRLLRPLASPKA